MSTSPTPTDPQARQKPTRNLWPFGVAGGLLLVVVVNIVMVVVAQGSPPIIETTDAYEAGLKHETVLAEARASAALGFQAQITTAGGAVEIVLHDPAQAPVTGFTGSVRLTRADTRSQDADLTLTEAGPGRYQAAFKGRGGIYRLEARLTDGQRTWVTDRRLRIDGPLRGGPQ